MSTHEKAARCDRPLHVPQERVVDFDIYAPKGLEEGYQRAWMKLQSPDTADLVWTPFNGGHWIATRGAIIREIFTDPKRFSNEVIFVPKSAGEKQGTVPNRMDPPEHRPYREVLDDALGLRKARRLEPAVRAMARELVEAILPRGECDFGKDFSGIYPIRIFMALADLPIEDVPRLQALAVGMTRPQGTTPDEMAKSLERATDGFHDYVGPIIDARFGGDGEDVISAIINSPVNGKAMDRDKAMGMITLLLLAGLDTVANFLSMMMEHLAERPDLQRSMAENPERIPRAVEEMFRRFPLVAVGRVIAEDIELDRVRLLKGEMVVLPTALQGLDETINDDPWDIKLDRPRIAHCTFGEGPHRCAGLHLARLETIIFLQEWFARIPSFSIAPDSRSTTKAGIVASIEGVRLQWGKRNTNQPSGT